MEALRQPRLERYEIVDQIGEGSMGTVYLARDLTTGEDVALKTLGGTELAEADLDRLRRLLLTEASAGPLLAHPGIVGIRDLIGEPGTPEVYLVMDYVSGSSLADVLARPDPVPFDFVVRVVGEVASVLDHLHGHGVVHRDIKPANILLDADGGVKVTDFGIAELRGGDLAAELQRAGSPHYMAPERLLGTGGDYRGDIWALGVVLYEMFTRRLPFQGESVVELVTRIASEEPAPLDSHGVAVIPGLQPIVDKALVKEPDERYQFAGELATELEAVQAGQMRLSATLPAEAIPEVAEDAAEGNLTKAARQPLLPAIVFERLDDWRRLAVLLALVALGLLGLWLSLRIGLGGWSAPEPPVPSAAQRQRFEYLTLLEEARQLLERGDSQAAIDLFARAEALSPDTGRIRALRAEARRQAEREIAAEIELEVASLIATGEADLREGRLSSAEAAGRRVLELKPRHPEGLALVAAVEESRRAMRARVERARALAVLAEQAPPPEPEPEPTLRVEQPIRPPVAPPAPTHSDLKIDFYSKLPRGVLTVYRADSQIFRRAFRFVEKKGFLRSRGISGGFDDQVRVQAGPSDFRIYLSLPDRETQVHRISGSLPPGAIRALQVRVDADGGLSVALH